MFGVVCMTVVKVCSGTHMKQKKLIARGIILLYEKNDFECVSSSAVPARGGCSMKK